nr:glycosyltransferase family 4 protein [uncultured Draconibacterium sp.]
MNLIFISIGKYPNQRASAIRHSTLAQGVYENGHNVWFFILSPQDWNCLEKEYNGVTYTSLNKYNGNNKILKALYFKESLVCLKKKISEIHNKNTVDGIITYSTNNLIIQTALSVGKKHKIRVFHERTELPYVIGKSQSFIGNLKYDFYLNKLIPKFDGIFVISDKLREFFLSRNRNIEKILTIVDTNFFNNQSKPIYNFPYIAYCGKMSGTKDGVPILVESFAKLLNQFPSYRLLLIGDNSDKNAIKDTIDSIHNFDMKDKIIFTGMVPREDMPKLLGNSSLLVVSKPDNEQNSGNFPIKVGEYLSTGIPVVVTKVGEIPKFITDGENGFLATPDSVESFYTKMHEALIDSNRARKIGMNGRVLAQEVFDYRIQAKKMTDFIYNTPNKWE